MTASRFRVLRHEDLAGVLRKGDSARVPDTRPARFAVGDRVVARKLHPVGHTRLPRYARGCRGEVVRVHGVFVFPDSHAASGDRSPQHCYAVRFPMRELWGAAASHRDTVVMDLFDDYLDPV